MKRRIYVASSWRNPFYDRILATLRGDGHECYDFKEDGFGWNELDPKWASWSPTDYAKKVMAPRSLEHFGQDFRALNWANTCVLILPCGRSAHLEAGYAIGQGKETHILLHPDKFEPELMYLMAAQLYTDLDDMRAQLCFPVVRSPAALWEQESANV